MKSIINGKIILKNNVLEDKVLVFDKKIKFLQDLPLENSEIIDAKGNYISPGFIDIHVHGGFGNDTMDASLKGLENIGINCIKNGVTNFLPTTMTMDKKSIYKSFEVVKKFMELKSYNGAKALGVHMEGPFINQSKKGAQNQKFIIEPEFDFIKNYKDLIKIITYAPEKDFNFRFLREVLEKTDINIFLGHSAATFEKARKAVELGAKGFTHLFNGMTGLHHREPGMVGAALTSKSYVELISDLVHVHPGLFQLLVDIKKEYLILITDGMSAKGMPLGKYDLGGQEVIVDENSARLSSGQLAGSILTLDKAVRNMVKHTKNPIYEIINLVTYNPAKLLGIHDIYGSINVGKLANLCILDKDLNVVNTFIRGKKVY